MRRPFWRTERQRDANRRWRALNVFVSPSTQRLEQLTPKFYGPSRRGPSCFFRSITCRERTFCLERPAKCTCWDPGVMRSMSTEQTTEKIEARRLVKSTSMPEQSWQALVFLVILILVGIGGMAALYYKLEHPADTRMIEDLSHGKIGSFLML